MKKSFIDFLSHENQDEYFINKDFKSKYIMMIKERKTPTNLDQYLSGLKI